MIEVFCEGLIVKSEANTPGHWTKRMKRFKQQKELLGWSLISQRKALAMLSRRPFTVTFTKVGGRAMDDDNLAGAFKACRDLVAQLLGINDGDKSAAVWRYDQRPRNRKESAGVILQIEEAV